MYLIPVDQYCVIVLFSNYQYYWIANIYQKHEEN
jgi:hypothetical protein